MAHPDTVGANVTCACGARGTLRDRDRSGPANLVMTSKKNRPQIRKKTPTNHNE